MVVAMAVGVNGGSLESGSGQVRSVIAHRSTPAATPDTVECSVPPQSVENFLATPAAEVGLMHMRQALPEGKPADAATAEAIGRTVRELEACANSGDFLRFLGMFTDSALQQTPLVTSWEDRVELAALGSATPTPFPRGERAVFAGPWHVEILPDGRVLAAVVWFGSESDACVDPNRITVLIFVEQGGRWRIDERVERVAEGELSDLVGPPPAKFGVEMCTGVASGPSPNDD